MGIGTILEFFQSEGKILLEKEKLKIRERGSEILGAVLWCVIEEIVRTRSSVNRNTRNETVDFIWVT